MLFGWTFDRTLESSKHKSEELLDELQMFNKDLPKNNKKLLKGGILNILN